MISFLNSPRKVQNLVLERPWFTFCPICSQTTKQKTKQNKTTTIRIDSQVVPRQAGGGSFKFETPKAYRAEPRLCHIFRWRPSLLCFAAKSSGLVILHLIASPVISCRLIFATDLASSQRRGLAQCTDRKARAQLFTGSSQKRTGKSATSSTLLKVEDVL